MTLREIQLKQIDVLDQITTINKNNPHNNGSVCKCELCSQIRKLGQQYEELSTLRRLVRLQGKESDSRIALIKHRKYNITKSDMEYLLIDKWMTQQEVAKYVGLSLSYVKRKCKSYGLDYQYIKSERLRRHEASV